MSREEFEKMSWEEELELMRANLRGEPLTGTEWNFNAATGQFEPASGEGD